MHLIYFYVIITLLLVVVVVHVLLLLLVVVVLIRRSGLFLFILSNVITHSQLMDLFKMRAGVLEPRILSVERDGGVVYSWRVSLALVSL